MDATDFGIGDPVNEGVGLKTPTLNPFGVTRQQRRANAAKGIDDSESGGVITSFTD